MRNSPRRGVCARARMTTLPDGSRSRSSSTAAAAEAAAVPVITVDGRAASGKGAVAQAAAEALNYHYLDSGKLYRAAALLAMRRHLPAEDTAAAADLLADAARDLPPLLDDPALPRPQTGQRASVLAADARVRRRLLPLQKAMRRPPGLVADGRDMGTVVFPDALLCVFLTADLPVRAARRLAQLQARGVCATMEAVCADLRLRDRQDETRATAPLKPPAGALVIDSTHQSIGDIVATILRAHRDAASQPSRAEQPL